MIASMTAFARKTKHTQWGILTWELRSVNHRFLDCSFRLPETLRTLESRARELISKQISRGKVDATLTFSLTEQMFKININEPLVEQLANLVAAIGPLFPDAQTNMMDILAWPGLIQKNEIETDSLTEEVLNILKITLEDLISMRQREGLSLKNIIIQKLVALRELVEQVKKILPTVIVNERTRILQRLAELKITVEEQRLAQEIAIAAQKADISEELDRLETHLGEIERTLRADVVMGRRLDFLTQELHREANTLSSKTSVIQITQASIEMKVLIEQIREQVQNIE